MAKKPSRSESGHWASEWGTDADFRLWLTFQPSALSATFGEYHNGQGRNVAAHVRTVAAGAGTGTKPPFSALPLTDAEHKATHQHGNGHFHDKEWWEAQAELHLRRWVRTRYTSEDDRDYRD